MSMRKPTMGGVSMKTAFMLLSVALLVSACGII
jgi:hypothetical protein